MERYASEIGTGLRDARRRRGLTLRQVAALSEGRFKPTSVAGYERGERAISVERFIELAQLYGVPGHSLLADIMRLVEGAPEPDVDLTALDVSEAAEEAMIAWFVRQMHALRRHQPTGPLNRRAGDPEVLVSAASAAPLDDGLRRSAPG
jgi:transcriptional regulator with XRE-family HTH domain